VGFPLHSISNNAFLTTFQGVYVLQDNFFRPIARISSWEGRADATRRAKLVCTVLITHVDSIRVTQNIQYVAMPAGIIRGTLIRLGLHGTVTPETNAPQCTPPTVPGENCLLRKANRYIPSQNSQIDLRRSNLDHHSRMAEYRSSITPSFLTRVRLRSCVSRWL
jgi:hypothetical protein